MSHVRQHALVTGGGTGIGYAIAQGFAAQGQRITLLGRKAEVLAAAVAKLLAEFPQAQCAYQVADVTDEAQAQAAFAAAVQHFGIISVLVNNAGQAQSAPFIKTSLAQWQQMLNVNLTGSFICTQAVLPAMIEAKFGRVINIASTAGLTGYGYVAAYCAAKHGVVGMTRALALELAGNAKSNGITVNAVCPGYTDTDIVADAVANIVAKTGRSAADALAQLSARNPQKRLVKPAEVADTVLWLAGAGASAITGQAIAVAGGEVL